MRNPFQGQLVWIVLLLTAVICAFIYYFPILRTADALGIQDWDQNFAWSEFTRMAILDYRQFPFWDPYRCGGAVHFANPQVGVLSLQTVFVLMFGTVIGIKVSIFIHGIIGFIGCFLLARHYGLSSRAAVISSVIFSFSSVVSSFLSTGMVVFISYAFSPYIILLYNKALTYRMWLPAAGGALAVSFYAGYHMALITLLFICMYTGIKCLYEKNGRHIYSLLIFIGIFIFLSLPKLLLALELYSIFPAANSDPSGYTPQNFIHFLVSRSQSLVSGNTIMWGIDEESLYVGIIPVLLSVFFSFVTVQVSCGMQCLFSLWQQCSY